MKQEDRANDRQDTRPTLNHRLAPRRGWLVLLITAVVLIIGGWEVLSPNSHLNQRSAIGAALAWACLGPLPSDARHINVVKAGSMFTREFSVTFESSASNVSIWIGRSPGVAEVIPEKDADGWLLYKIQPCERAAHAELRISPDNTRVRIHAVWS